MLKYLRAHHEGQRPEFLAALPRVRVTHDHRAWNVLPTGPAETGARPVDTRDGAIVRWTGLDIRAARSDPWGFSGKEYRPPERIARLDWPKDLFAVKRAPDARR